MKHVWVNTQDQCGYKTIFKCLGNDLSGRLLLSAGPIYSVFFDNVLVSYGPERTARGFSRIREINVPLETKEIKVGVLVYGVDSLDIDNGNPFFGCALYSKENKLIKSTKDFKAYKSSLYETKSFKFSYQRGFGERFNLLNVEEKELETIEIPSPTIISGVGDTCKYTKRDFNFIKCFDFIGFDGVNFPNYTYRKPEFYAFDPQKDFLDVINHGYKCFEYELKEEKSGLLQFEISSKEEDVKIFVVFDEYLQYGKWVYGRSSCHDLITIETGKGEHTLTTSTVYALKHLRILVNKDVVIKPSIILIQNDNVKEIEATGDEKLDKIIHAARNTFMQNAVDIYTDCPGRERGGWLCDGYFISMAESFFTGKNDIERCFLENFTLRDYPEIEDGMLPMVFPGADTTFIPNWAMWYVLELEQYYKKTGDIDLVNKAKDKVDRLIKYFAKFENEYNLLENLHSWVFVEWSEAGTEDYVKGLSFPTNMLYKAMLESVFNLYGYQECLDKSKIIKENINKLSFNGELYIDNAIRGNGKLKLVKEHTSETCQYYALFFNLTNDGKYINFVKNELGPLRDRNKHSNIARSNSFIGNYLRFLWLNRINENERVKRESIEYFYQMANYSGTLWEKSVPSASCNHGFVSSIAAILLKK